MKAPHFQNRWLIAGTLTTQSELHIGDGATGEIHDRGRAKDNDDESDASTVCVDWRGRAMIPGSSLKGVLRARVATELADEKRLLGGWWERNKANTFKERETRPVIPWTDLLGSDDPDSGAAVGGKLVFFDAFHTDVATEEELDKRAGNPTAGNRKRLKDTANSDRDLPFWDPIRRTCVAVSVSLDRRTRTSRESLLYHTEYVPSGESFRVEIGGENLTDHDVGLILQLLETFNGSGSGRAALGACGSSGWGQMGWQADKKIHCLTRNTLAQWIKNPVAGYQACTEQRDAEEVRAMAGWDGASGPRLTIQLSLAMVSPWLVRDARQRERVEDYEGKQEGKPADSVPVHDETGRAFLPAKSLRGALRSRAEMILRTLGLECAAHPGDVASISTKTPEIDVALRKLESGDTGESDALAETQAFRSLDLAAKLFGAPGWLAPLEISRFIPETAPSSLPQEFVAIDRFTGGAAEQLKFNAVLAGTATLRGVLKVDLFRLQLVDREFASLGLLALVLRDLAEGDIPVGSGSSKGQGFCTAGALPAHRAPAIAHAGASYDSLDAWFSAPAVTAALAALRPFAPPPAAAATAND